MRQGPLDELRLLDTGDHLEPPAAARAPLDLDAEYPLQLAGPSHDHVQRRLALGRADRPPSPPRAIQRIVRTMGLSVNSESERRVTPAGKQGKS